MKKAALTLLLALRATIGAHSQSWIGADNFNNVNLTPDAPSGGGVFDCGVLATGNFNVSLYGGNSSNNLSLVATLLQSSGNIASGSAIGAPGQWIDLTGQSYYVPGVGLGTNGFFKVFAWEGDFSSYTDAAAAGECAGSSAVFHNLTASATYAVIDLSGMPSFDICPDCPEPGTLSLCGLGAASLLFLPPQKKKYRLMKKTVITTLLAVIATIGAQAQGTIAFDNQNNINISNPGATNSGGVINGITGLPQTGDFNLQLYGGSSANNLVLIATLLQSDGSAATGDAIGAPGQWIDTTGVSYIVPGVPIAGTGFFQVYAWIGNFNSVDAAAAAFAPTGQSGIFSNPTGGGTIPPADLTGMPSFFLPCLCPEPGSLTLCGLGVVSLLLFRRKK